MVKNSTRNFLLVVLGLLFGTIIVTAISYRLGEKSVQLKVGTEYHLDEEILDLARPLIKHREGLKLDAYPDGKGFAIGYGHYGAKAGDVITEAQAERLLEEDMRQALRDVKDLLTTELKPCQYAALVSWRFNFSRSKMITSGLLEAVNEQRFDDVPDQLRRWVYHEVDGKMVRSDWLVAAREAEVNLWGECATD